MKMETILRMKYRWLVPVIITKRAFFTSMRIIMSIIENRSDNKFGASTITISMST